MTDVVKLLRQPYGLVLVGGDNSKETMLQLISFHSPSYRCLLLPRSGPDPMLSRNSPDIFFYLGDYTEDQTVQSLIDLAITGHVVVAPIAGAFDEAVDAVRNLPGGQDVEIVSVAC